MATRDRAVRIVIALCAGCGGSSTAVDSAPPPDIAVAPDASPWRPAQAHLLYLNVDGATLVPGDDDATQNHSALVTHPVAVRGFRVDDADRQSKIDAIVAELEALVAPYDISIVTVRPASGTYAMSILTDDDSMTIGLSPGLASATRSSCNQYASPLSFEFGYTTIGAIEPHDLAARNALAMFADEMAVPLSRTAGDCMCLGCFVPSPCAIGGPNTLVDRINGCAGPDGPETMDEAAVFSAVFGPRS